jgi:hypothetical protein
MNNPFPTEDTIRQYLFGRLDDQQDLERKLSEQIFLDDELSEVVDSIEDEIIEDYLDDRVNIADRVAIENYFMRTAERKEKLEVARLLHTLKNRGNQLSATANSLLDNRVTLRPPRLFYSGVFVGAASVLLLFGIMQILIVLSRRSPNGINFSLIPLLHNYVALFALLLICTGLSVAGIFLFRLNNNLKRYESHTRGLLIDYLNFVLYPVERLLYDQRSPYYESFSHDRAYLDFKVLSDTTKFDQQMHKLYGTASEESNTRELA